MDNLFIWEIAMASVDLSGNKCNLTITSGGEHKLFKVIFGDVWFCAGQSNLNWHMGHVYDAAKEHQEGSRKKNLLMIEKLTKILLFS